jgi:hypothetical protein
MTVDSEEGGTNMLPDATKKLVFHANFGLKKASTEIHPLLSPPPPQIKKLAVLETA